MDNYEKITGTQNLQVGDLFPATFGKGWYKILEVHHDVGAVFLRLEDIGKIAVPHMPLTFRRPKCD